MRYQGCYFSKKHWLGAWNRLKMFEACFLPYRNLDFVGSESVSSVRIWAYFGLKQQDRDGQESSQPRIWSFRFCSGAQSSDPAGNGFRLHGKGFPQPLFNSFYSRAMNPWKLLVNPTLTPSGNSTCGGCDVSLCKDYIKEAIQMFGALTKLAQWTTQGPESNSHLK